MESLSILVAFASVDGRDSEFMSDRDDVDGAAADSAPRNVYAGTDAFEDGVDGATIGNSEYATETGVAKHSIVGAYRSAYTYSAKPILGNNPPIDRRLRRRDWQSSISI